MTKQQSTKNKRLKIAERRMTNKVWRIFHFEQRYEMPEDMKSNRKSGLNYTKRFVGTNGGDEAVGYQQQMGMLCNGDGQEACLLEGLYGKLVNMAAALSRAKRGYLIDADDKPLSAAQIGKLLNIKPPTMRKMIARFEKVKLLEHIEMPEFDLSKNEPPVSEKSKKSGGKTGGSGAFRKIPENSGKKRKPLKKKPNLNYNSNDNLNKKGLKEDKEFKILTDFKQEKDITNQRPGTDKHQQNGQQNPSNPMESEADSAFHAKQTGDNQNSMESEVTAVEAHHVPRQPSSAFRGGNPKHIGHIISGWFPPHWQDLEAEAFGWEMVEALGISTNRSDQNSRSEWGAFASWLCKLKQVVPGHVCDDLKSKAIEKAKYVRKKAKKGNKSAIWTSIMAGELASRDIKLPDDRAGPVSKLS